MIVRVASLLPNLSVALGTSADNSDCALARLVTSILYVPALAALSVVALNAELLPLTAVEFNVSAFFQGGRRGFKLCQRTLQNTISGKFAFITGLLRG